MSYIGYLLSFMTLVPPLASLASARPAFLIVMAGLLLLSIWRLAKISDGWAPRLLMAGAVILALGYGLLLPFYEAGLVERYSPARLHDPGSAAAFGWHVIKMATMNLGWLVMGLGLVMHARTS